MTLFQNMCEYGFYALACNTMKDLFSRSISSSEEIENLKAYAEQITAKLTKFTPITKICDGT